jgi:hypothetical protein
MAALGDSVTRLPTSFPKKRASGDLANVFVIGLAVTKSNTVESGWI